MSNVIYKIKTPTKSRGQFENIHRNDAKVFLKNILAPIVEISKYKKELWDNLVALCLWWIIIITQKGLSKQPFSVGATAPVPEIPSGYVHIAYMALNPISLWNSQKIEIVCASDPVELLTLFFSKSHFCCGYIITQKKAPANARASTTTTMLSLLWSEGRWYTPFYFILIRGLV